MTSKVKHWGEMEDDDKPENNFVPDVSADIERAMNKFCLAEFETDYDDGDSPTEEHVVIPPADPLVMYAISLHKYLNEMNDMIRVADLAIESNLIPPADAAPPVPEMPEVKRKHSRNTLNFIPKEFTPFVLGQKVDVPEFSSTVVRQILSKSVATLLAHVGYETTHQSILDIMTDVTEEFLKKMAYSLKVAHEDEMKGNLGGFPNIVEKVLVELGMGGAKGLHDYYQTRVVKYVKTLQVRCKEMKEHYEGLLIRNSPQPPDKDHDAISMKMEGSDDAMEVENSQVQLAIEGEVGFSSLDAGYQLLSSLEAGATYSFNQ